MVREDVSWELLSSADFADHNRRIHRCAAWYVSPGTGSFANISGTRKYIPAITVINKVDSVSMETMDRLAREGDGRTVMISCEIDLGLDWLLETIWQVSLSLAVAKGKANELGTGSGQVCSTIDMHEGKLTKRVYTKKRGEQPDLSDPICLRQGATIETVCHGIHRSLASHFKYVVRGRPCSDTRYALVWGKSSKFNPQPQKVGLTHYVQDEDV